MEIRNKKLIFASFAFILILVFSVFINLAYASEITISNVIELVNASRNKEGLNDLGENKTLDKIARDKLEDMIKNNYFAHTSPKGATPWSWFEKEGYDYRYAGENLAINFLTAEGQHKAWMESPTHKKNIMNPQFLEIGVAVAAGEINNQTAIITVQEFGTLAGAGEAASKKENFSAKGKKDVLEEDQKIPPTVLSVKNENNPAGKGTQNEPMLADGYLSKLQNAFSKNRNAVLEYSQIASLFILFSSLLVSVAVLLREAGKTLAAFYETEREQGLNSRDILKKEYLRIVKRFRKVDDEFAKVGES